jgi:hypothetical protein
MESLQFVRERIEISIKVAACVCGKDGVISQTEEQAIFKFISDRFPECDLEMFENALTEFFDSNYQIEEYLMLIDNRDQRLFTLNLAEYSASADGLDVRENIALEKAYIYWEIERNA